MDEELLELSKRVYKLLPEWETEDWWAKSAYSGNYSVVPSKSYSSKSFSDEGDAGSYYDYLPHYTSDYLLEKLPKEIYKDETIYRIELSSKFGDEFKANYVTPTGILYFFLEPESDTPLKTLLELTLSLKEAGEI